MDIWRTATTLINTHGLAYAARFAGLRVSDLRDMRDLDGADVWRRIEDSIPALGLDIGRTQRGISTSAIVRGFQEPITV